MREIRRSGRWRGLIRISQLAQIRIICFPRVCRASGTAGDLPEPTGDGRPRWPAIFHGMAER